MAGEEHCAISETHMYRGKCPSSQAAISKTEKNADLRKTFENFNIQAHVNPNREMHE